MEVMMRSNTQCPQAQQTQHYLIRGVPMGNAMDGEDINVESEARTVAACRRRLLSVSTTLRLYEDPWKIRKTLQQSDVDRSSRLLLPKEEMEAHVLPQLEEEGLGGVCGTREGRSVCVWDIDTGSEHHLVLKQWATRSYVLTSNWNREFVTRRGLGVGDEVGLYWDAYYCRFHFGLLNKAAA